MKSTSQNQNQENPSLESRLIATGISVGFGVIAGLISKFSDNQFDSYSPLSSMLPILGAGWVAGSAYLALYKENAKEKLAGLRNHTITYAAMTASYLGTYFL